MEEEAPVFGSRLPVLARRALPLLVAVIMCACGGADRSLTHGSSVVALAISHDGLRLVSGGADGPDRDQGGDQGGGPARLGVS